MQRKADAKAITESILGIGRAAGISEDDRRLDTQLSVERVPVRLETQLRDMLPAAKSGFQTQADVEDWLHANNALFYEALAWEVKMVERQIRSDLQDFQHVHIDLEPW